MCSLFLFPPKYKDLYSFCSLKKQILSISSTENLAKKKNMYISRIILEINVTDSNSLFFFPYAFVCSFAFSKTGIKYTYYFVASCSLTACYGRFFAVTKSFSYLCIISWSRYTMIYYSNSIFKTIEILVFQSYR